VQLGSKLVTGALVAVSICPALSRAEGETIERIDVQGLFRMDPQAFMYLLELEAGDPYDEARLRRQFRVLWDKRLFEDLTIEAETGAEGRVVVIKVRERPVLTSITYEENKVLTRTQIEDHFKSSKIDLRLGQALDMGQVFFAEAAIRDLFGQKGFLDASVDAEVSEVTTTTRAIEFRMSPGGKTRIRSIDFTGNQVFKDRKIKKMLQLTQERRWWWPWSSKNLYHPLKWDQDVARVRDSYQNRGYLDIQTHAPIVEVRQKKGAKKKKLEPQAAPAVPAPAPVEPPAAGPPDDPAAQAAGQALTAKQLKKQEKKRSKEQRKARERERKARQKDSKRWVYLTVPLAEGAQYRLGNIEVTGNLVFPTEVLRQQIPLETDAILNNGALKAGVDRITRLYEDRGYLYANVVQRLQRRPDGRIADVSLALEEDRPYRVGRIELRGNSATQDRVLRRELRLMEGDLFSRTKLIVSRTKVNQLGYFQIVGEPVIEPIENEDKVRITLTGIEQGRNEIQIGGGYSGFEGAFFSGIYSTRNFLGRGQVVSAAVQVGGTVSRYQLSFQEPWFLGRPYQFGVSLYRRETDYGASLSSEATGGGVMLGRRIGNFSRVNLAYNFEDVTSRSITSGTSMGENTVIETNFLISSLTPLYSFSTVDSPYKPTRGVTISTSVQVAGGPLGGDVSYYKPLANVTVYRRAFGRSFVAVHGEAGFVRQFGDLDVVGASDVEGVPRYQRFWLGGDTLGPRVFETRTITPRRFVRIVDGVIVDVVGDVTGLPPDGFITENGVPVPIELGGDRMYLLQSEWVMSLNEQADLAVFFDVGDSLFEDTSIDFTTTRVSAGMELRFHLPIFPVPLRLIYGVPVREIEGDSTSNFTFSIGRSF